MRRSKEVAVVIHVRLPVLHFRLVESEAASNYFYSWLPGFLFAGV
jgi:hypothetical protein